MPDGTAAPSNTATAQLEALFPSAVKVEAGGKTIEVRPLGIRTLGRLARALEPLSVAIEGTDRVTIGGILAEHHEDLIEAVVIATGESDAFIAELRADEFIALAGAIVKVNQAFFILRVVPGALAILRSLFPEPPSGAGPTLSGS